MRIKRLELKNFRGFEDAAVDFPEENVVVFFGENGGGKTSILDAIAKSLSYEISNPWDSPSVSPQLKFEVEDISVRNKNSKVNVTLEWADDSQIFAHTFESHSTGINKGSDNHKLFNRFENIINKNGPLPVLVYFKTNREIQPFKKEEIFSESNRLQSYKMAFTASIDDFRDFEEWFRFQEDFENQEKIARKDLDFKNDQLEPLRSALHKFLKPLSGISGDLKVKRIDYANSFFRNYSLVTTKNGQELRLSQLSSGERALILLVADIARRAAIANPQIPDPLQSEGIVLIDEIELHLHPKWQRTVIPALRKTFPNIQFIIATHSPQVLSNVENGCVFEVEDFQIKPRNTYGRDNQWILEAIMDDEPRPKDIQDKLDKYFTLIRNGDLDAATELRSELEALIGTDEPEFAKADILIRRKERNPVP